MTVSGESAAMRDSLTADRVRRNGDALVDILRAAY